MAVTRLWWVRHGPTHEKAFTGWRDVPADLSDQAALDRLNAYLPQGARVVSSDLIRAVATADALSAGRIRLPAQPDLREFNFGDWDGRHWSDVAASHPDLSRAYWEDPGDHAPPNGESWNRASARISAAVDALIAEYRGHDIIAIAHFGTILTQLQRARKCSAYNVLSQGIDTLSVTMLTVSDGVWHEEIANHHP